jgi:hypothetical protein
LNDSFILMNSRVFGSMVVIAYESVFRLEMHQNNVFLFFLN